jgi:hypothetical protein
MLALAAALLVVAPLLLAGAWIALLEGVTPSIAPQRRKLVVAFAYAWPGRYIPGTVPFFAGKVLLGKRFGYGNRELITAVAVQSVMEVLVSTVVGATMLTVALGVTAGDGRYAALAIVPTMALIALHPAILGRCIDRALRIFGRDPLPARDLPPVRAILLAAAMIACNQLLVGVASLIVLQAIAGLEVRDFLLVTGAMSLSGVCGILVVFAPAGLGVRDGVLAGLLAARIGVDAAALGAVVLRMLTVVADVALLAAAFMFDVATNQQVVMRRRTMTARGSAAHARRTTADQEQPA